MVHVKHIQKTKRFLLAGAVSLIFPLYFLGLWIYVAETATGTHRELRHIFFSYFPPVLHNSLQLTAITLVCCLAAFVFGFMALPTDNSWLQAAALLVMGAASLFGLWFFI